MNNMDGILQSAIKLKQAQLDVGRVRFRSSPEFLQYTLHLLKVAISGPEASSSSKKDYDDHYFKHRISRDQTREEEEEKERKGGEKEKELDNSDIESEIIQKAKSRCNTLKESLTDDYYTHTPLYLREISLVCLIYRYLIRALGLFPSSRCNCCNYYSNTVLGGTEVLNPNLSYSYSTRLFNEVIEAISYGIKRISDHAAELLKVTSHSGDTTRSHIITVIYYYVFVIGIFSYIEPKRIMSISPRILIVNDGEMMLVPPRSATFPDDENKENSFFVQGGKNDSLCDSLVCSEHSNSCPNNVRSVYPLVCKDNNNNNNNNNNMGNMSINWSELRLLLNECISSFFNPNSTHKSTDTNINNNINNTQSSSSSSVRSEALLQWLEVLLLGAPQPTNTNYNNNNNNNNNNNSSNSLCRSLSNACVSGMADEETIEQKGRTYSSESARGNNTDALDGLDKIGTPNRPSTQNCKSKISELFFKKGGFDDNELHFHRFTVGIEDLCVGSTWRSSDESRKQQQVPIASDTTSIAAQHLLLHQIPSILCNLGIVLQRLYSLDIYPSMVTDAANNTRNSSNPQSIHCYREILDHWVILGNNNECASDIKDVTEQVPDSVLLTTVDREEVIEKCDHNNNINNNTNNNNTGGAVCHLSLYDSAFLMYNPSFHDMESIPLGPYKGVHLRGAFLLAKALLGEHYSISMEEAADILYRAVSNHQVTYNRCKKELEKNISSENDTFIETGSNTLNYKHKTYDVINNTKQHSQSQDNVGERDEKSNSKNIMRIFQEKWKLNYEECTTLLTTLRDEIEKQKRKDIAFFKRGIDKMSDFDGKYKSVEYHNTSSIRTEANGTYTTNDKNNQATNISNNHNNSKFNEPPVVEKANTSLLLYTEASTDDTNIKLSVRSDIYIHRIWELLVTCRGKEKAILSSYTNHTPEERSMTNSISTIGDEDVQSYSPYLQPDASLLEIRKLMYDLRRDLLVVLCNRLLYDKMLPLNSFIITIPSVAPCNNNDNNNDNISDASCDITSRGNNNNNNDYDIDLINPEVAEYARVKLGLICIPQKCSSQAPVNNTSYTSRNSHCNIHNEKFSFDEVYKELTRLIKELHIRRYVRQYIQYSAVNSSRHGSGEVNNNVKISLLEHAAQRKRRQESIDFNTMILKRYNNSNIEQGTSSLFSPRKKKWKDISVGLVTCIIDILHKLLCIFMCTLGIRSHCSRQQIVVGHSNKHTESFNSDGGYIFDNGISRLERTEEVIKQLGKFLSR